MLLQAGASVQGGQEERLGVRRREAREGGEEEGEGKEEEAEGRRGREAGGGGAVLLVARAAHLVLPPLRRDLSPSQQPQAREREREKSGVNVWRGEEGGEAQTDKG